MKISQELIAAIIAYPMSDAGFTERERERIARVFAAELRVKNPERFLERCRKASEVDPS